VTDAEEPPASAAIEQLRALARRSLSGDAPKRNAASLEGVERALSQRLIQRRRTRLQLGASALLLAAAICLYVGVLRRAPALAFEVLRGSVAASGFIDGTEQQTLLRFTDGTELELAARARTRIAALSADGADIALEHGRVQLRVVPRPGASWSVRAGAYLVSVTGTAFDVEFDPERRWLAIDLFKGSVKVSGPLIHGGLAMSAGQRLMVLPEDSLVLVQRDAPPAAAPAPAEPAGKADASAVLPSEPEASDASLERPLPRASRRPRSQSGKPGAARGAESWSQLVAAGRFDEVLRSAEQRTLERVTREAPFDDLQALADAARYARQNTVARAALIALRERFATSTAAKEAAFFLGRLEESGGSSERALVWYELYLEASPSGTYASQALGRQLLLVAGQRGREAARPIAREYLRRFPDGPYASSAAALVGSEGR
jgi:ferric-dicitrate binding protein FerR (iron transport regulator)